MNELQDRCRGSLLGGAVGDALGYNAIPRKYLANLELHDVVLSVADDLGGFSSPAQMKERYRNKKQSLNEQI